MAPDTRGIEFDTLPSGSAAIGDYQIYGRIGDMIRIGQGLNADFGIPTIQAAAVRIRSNRGMRSACSNPWMERVSVP